MAKKTSTFVEQQSSLRPIIIFAFAVTLLLSKSQRAACEERNPISTESDDQSGSPVCPDYCNLTADRGSTRGKAPFRMWYFDVSEGSCVRFRWSGRGGNRNRFLKKADCEETCSKCSLQDVLDGETPQRAEDAVCSQPVDDGRCETEEQKKASRQPELVWHFDTNQAKCSPFIFYGCGGNTNRFMTRDQCEAACH